jgi:hypothetical protein
MGKLRLRIEPDDGGDEIAELFADFEVGGFAGWGSAWIKLSQLKDLAGQFEKYPLDSNNLPHIEGGYWNNDGSKLEQEHLHISAYPVNQRGGIGIQVCVTTPYEYEADRRAKRHAVVELQVNYAQLANFSEELKKMAEGSSTEAMLEDEQI